MIDNVLYITAIANDWLWIKRRYHHLMKKNKSSEKQIIVNQYPLSREQEQEIDDFFNTNYGHKISYDWHRYSAAHSGVFNAQYFPEILFYTYFERFMNPNLSYNQVLQDKNILPYIAKSAGVLMPKTVVSYTQGIYRDGNDNVLNYQNVVNILRDNGRLFCKPSRSSWGGHSCFCADFGQKEVNIDSSLKSLGKEFVIQETISCDSSIKAVYPDAVNTFRVVTYRWKDSFYFIPAVMRIGHGGAVVDNASSGGMFVSISDGGCLQGSAVTKGNKKFSEHPDTHLVFDGHQINNFAKVREAAMKMHTTLPQIGVVGWDFTINENGQPILIEANIGMVSYRLCQMTLGIPAFGDRTAEILQWIRKMKQVPYSKRGDYAFGT
jgi:hypothetical protein